MSEQDLLDDVKLLLDAVIEMRARLYKAGDTPLTIECRAIADRTLMAIERRSTIVQAITNIMPPND